VARRDGERLDAVSVIVLDRDGAPVAGEEVELTGQMADVTDWMDYGSHRSGDDGTARLPLDPAAADGVASLRLSVRRPGFAARDAHVSLSSALRGRVEVTLDRALTVVGRVVDRTGQPLGGIRVKGPRDAPEVHSDALGNFRLDGVSETGGFVRVLPSFRQLAPRRVELPAAAAGVVDLGDVLLDAGDTVRGRFLDAAGNPIAGAQVYVVNRELNALVGAAVVTDAEGRFAFEHAGRGTHDVGFTRSGFNLDGGDLTNIAYDVRTNEEVIVRATRDHYVHVQFLGEAGELVTFPGGRVVWYALDDTSDRLDWRGLEGMWDHFHIAARPGATYEIRLELDGYEPAVVRATATEALDVRVDAVLRRKLL
jgi:hypothetical protein